MELGRTGALRCAVVAAALVLAGPAAVPAAAAVTVTDVRVEEGRAAVFTVRTDSPVGEAVQVATRDGTAAAPADYTATTANVAVPAGATGTTVSVPTRDETDVEGDEAFTLTVDPVAPGETRTATATILNDDAPPIVSAVRPAREGDASQTIAVALFFPSTKTVTVEVATAAGSATAGTDFTPASATLRFAPGEQLKELAVPLLDDALFEGDETWEARLADPVHGVIANAVVPATITEDDPLPTLSIEGGGPVAEGDEGTQTTSVRLRLSAPSGLPATIAVATERGTATSPADFTALTAVVPFAAGETTKDVAVAIRGDDELEPDERFRVLAGSLAGAQTPGGQAVAVTVTIRNDDRDTTPPVASLAAPRLRGSVLSTVVACAAGEELCAGQVTFFKDADRRARDRGVRGEARLGRVPFRLAGGTRRTVRLRLGRSRLALLRRAGRPRVTGYLVAEDAARNRRATRRSARISVR